MNIAQAVEQAGLQASDITRIDASASDRAIHRPARHRRGQGALASPQARNWSDRTLAPQCLAHTQATDDRRHRRLPSTTRVAGNCISRCMTAAPLRTASDNRP